MVVAAHWVVTGCGLPAAMIDVKVEVTSWQYGRVVLCKVVVAAAAAAMAEETMTILSI